MKKSILIIATILLCVSARAQEQLSFPFQGGKSAMMKFFKDSLEVSPEIIQKRATGTAVFKFTADVRGVITKIVIYYADDALLVTPVTEALRRSSHKWIIPDREKTHDFILSFVFSFNAPASAGTELQKAVYDNYSNHNPMVSADQIPLNETTLLPPVLVSYDLAQ
jgi:predicted SnoaL-like aldol condensation-catalyzing enzyme